MLQAHALGDLVALGTLTAQAARFLEATVAAGLNMLVSGRTQAGQTTLLSCLRLDPGKKPMVGPFVRDASTPRSGRALRASSARTDLNVS